MQGLGDDRAVDGCADRRVGEVRGECDDLGFGCGHVGIRGVHLFLERLGAGGKIVRGRGRDRTRIRLSSALPIALQDDLGELSSGLLVVARARAAATRARQAGYGHPLIARVQLEETDLAGL